MTFVILGKAPSIYPGPDGTGRKKNSADRVDAEVPTVSMLRLFSQQPGSYKPWRVSIPTRNILITPSCVLHCLAEVSLFAPLLSSPIDPYCLRVDPACDESLVRDLRSPGAHIRQLVLSDRGGSSLGIQTIQLSKNMREKYPLTW